MKRMTRLTLITAGAAAAFAFTLPMTPAHAAAETPPAAVEQQHADAPMRGPVMLGAAGAAGLASAAAVAVAVSRRPRYRR